MTASDMLTQAADDIHRDLFVELGLLTTIGKTHINAANLIKMQQAEITRLHERTPVAWRTYDGEGGYRYCSYAGNESYRDGFIEANGQSYADWVEPLYL